MIAIRIKARTDFPSGVPVRIQDVAYVISDARVNAGSLTLPMPRDTGVWLVDAGSILSAIYKNYPAETVRLLGDSIGWLRRKPERSIRAHSREWLRQACAALFGRINASADAGVITARTLLADRAVKPQTSKGVSRE